MEHLRILGFQAALDDVQVVGIHLGLIRSDGIGPATQVAHDVLHIEVTTLHDTHLDGGTTIGHTGFGELQQLRLEVPGIRQIGLHHDARLVVLELRQREHILEEFHRQMGIFILLHIEVDELGPLHTLRIGVRIIDGSLIEFRHTTYQFWEALLIIQRMRLGVDAGDLHADVVDIGFLQRLEIGLIALVGLTVAQHDLTQEVHVLSDVLIETGGQMLGQIRTRCVDDDATGVSTQAPLDDGNGDPVEQRQIGELLIHTEQQVVGRPQELGDAILVDQVLHPSGQFLGVTHLTRLVEHTDNELLVRRCRHHRSIHVLLTLFQCRQP